MILHENEAESHFSTVNSFIPQPVFGLHILTFRKAFPAENALAMTDNLTFSSDACNTDK